MSPPFRLRLLRRASAWLLVLAPGCGGRATSFVEGRDGGTGTGQTGDASAGGESGQGSGADAADVWSALSDAGSAGAEPGDVWSAPFDGASTDSEPGDAWSAPFDAASTDANASDEWSATSDAGSADAEPSDAPAAYPCESPQDCAAHIVFGLQVYCCIDHVCIEGQAAESLSCDDPDAQVIQASNYDQSCATDSDCVAVGEGNFCYPGAGRCPSAAIRKSAIGQYQADVAKTWAAACIVTGFCPGFEGPSCQAGMCQ
ncbi:MAG: hypothetical protein WBY94_06220 [Polyangiaceae bacterium]